jgi:alkylation response protein AidB-like acyl-CoA dehydrogenase
VWGFGVAVTALGTARTALDAVQALAAEKTPFGGRGALRDLALAQGQVGEAEAHWRSGRALIYEVLHRVWEGVSSRGEITLEQRVEIRLAVTHAIRLAARAVDLCYDVGGSSSLFADSPLQRCFQDMHAITQHLHSRLAHYESAGRFYLGLEPDMEWL